METNLYNIPKKEVFPVFLHPDYSTLPADCQLTEQAEKMSWRKALSHVVADAYDLTPYTRFAAAIRACAEYVIVRRYDTADQKLETAYTQYCGSRLCPVCAHRRSLKSFWQLSRILDLLDQWRAESGFAPYQYVLVTLTMANVPGEALQEALDRMQASYTKLSRSKPWQSAYKGAWRTLEITYNAEQDSFHPHLHVFLAVNPSYFKDRTYLSQAKITELWRRSAKLPYTPIVDVRRVKEIGGGKAEVSKYITKPTSIFENLTLAKTSELLIWLTDATMYKKAYITYGVIREAARALHLSDEDGQLLDPTDGDEALAAQLRPECSYVYQLLQYSWTDGTYKTTPIYTDKEIARLPLREKILQEKLAGFKLQQDLDAGDRNPDELTATDRLYLKAAYPPKKDEKPEIEQAFDEIPEIKTFNPNILYEE